MISRIVCKNIKNRIKGRREIWRKRDPVTHPDYAKSLVGPLFAARIEGNYRFKRKYFVKSYGFALFPRSEERVVERSKDRVSLPGRVKMWPPETLFRYSFPKLQL